MTLFCLVFPFFLFLHVCCFINVALFSSALLSFVRACFAFSCWCCRLDERLGKGGGGEGGQDDEERLFASDAGSWYTVSDVDCSEDSSDDGNDDVDDDSTTSVDGSDDDEEEDDDDDDDDDRFTLQRCRRRVRNVIVSDTDSDNSGA